MFTNFEGVIIGMFEGREFPKSLEETVFNRWLEDGRMSLIGYHYLVVVWDEYESSYMPVYLTDRNKLETHTVSPGERFVAAYDLYSESRIL